MIGCYSVYSLRLGFKERQELTTEVTEVEIFLIGKHKIDFLVSGEVIVELKAVETMNRLFDAQVLTYLKASNKRIGLLINFNVERLKYGIKRFIL